MVAQIPCLCIILTVACTLNAQPTSTSDTKCQDSNILLEDVLVQQKQMMEYLKAMQSSSSSCKPCVIPSSTTASIPATSPTLSSSTSSVTTEGFSDCSELWKNGTSADGVYTISITVNGTMKTLHVYCEFTEDGGWTRIQHRQDGSVDFYRNWTSYKNGFGNIAGEHWIGNDNIHDMTSQKSYILRVNLQLWDNTSYYAEYTTFKVDDESANYKLHISGHRGDARDSLGNHDNQQFSTYDRDNDMRGGPCSVYNHGAWWYHDCGASNLNAQYWHLGRCSYSDTRKCIEWYHLKYSSSTPYRQVSMLIKDPSVKKNPD